MIMNLNGRTDDVVVLVRVSPDGAAEKHFMNDWKKIQKELKVTSSAVQLYALFGWVRPTGEQYTQYVLDFESEDDFKAALNWLTEYFRQMVIEHEEVYNDGMLPEVVFARKIKE